MKKTRMTRRTMKMRRMVVMGKMKMKTTVEESKTGNAFELKWLQ